MMQTLCIGEPLTHFTACSDCSARKRFIFLILVYTSTGVPFLFPLEQGFALKGVPFQFQHGLLAKWCSGDRLRFVTCTAALTGHFPMARGSRTNIHRILK